MAKTKTEIQKKYQGKFKRPNILIKKEIFNNFDNFVKNKGYTGLNDYFNFVLEYDLKNNIIPNKDVQSADNN